MATGEESNLTAREKIKVGWVSILFKEGGI